MTCEVCGPQPERYVHSICHGPTLNYPHRVDEGCGHPIDDHSLNTLTCRTCGRQCGRSVIVPDYVHEHGWLEGEPEPADAEAIDQERLW